jgi:hypothetical protein
MEREVWDHIVNARLIGRILAAPVYQFMDTVTTGSPRNRSS